MPYTLKKEPLAQPGAGKKCFPEGGRGRGEGEGGGREREEAKEEDEEDFKAYPETWVGLF